jgi:hypothetical protein
MRPLLACAFLSLTLWAAPASAHDDATGRVRGIYYEAARGVLIDASMLRKASAARWADVELDAGQRVLVQLPRGIDAGVGDLVSLHLGDGKWTQLAADVAVLRNSRITQVLPSSKVASPAN